MKQDQRALHEKAIKRLAELEGIIDKMKQAGPHPLDGNNALMNTRERLRALADRCGHV